MPDAKQPGRWWRRKAKAPTRTWTYRCYVDCADEVVGWATGRPGFKVRVSREKGGWPVVVTLRGPAGAVLPEADGGIVAGWGVTAPWHYGLPVGYGSLDLPAHFRERLLEENRKVREQWDGPDGADD